MIPFLVALALLVACSCVVCSSPSVPSFSYSSVSGSPYNVSYDGRAIKINNQRVLLQSGSIHYPRSTPEMWPNLLSLSRSGGLNLIQMYLFWNYHEQIKGHFDFTTENRNFLEFIQKAADADLFINLRIGPYVCAEWTFGGLPVWLRSEPNITMRSNNDVWKLYMGNFVKLVAQMVEPYLARNGGPIILVQIENEYGNIESGYPDHAAYVEWSANFANGLELGVPIIMCQQDDAPDTVIQTCNGYYCDNWISGHASRRPGQPHLWTENWPGWFQAWGEPVPHRPSEDVAFSIARWVMRGGTHFNYYMWHGGTTFGRWAGGPFDITSYDYDVALNEYGIPAVPKYSHLSALHLVLSNYSSSILSVDDIPQLTKFTGSCPVNTCEVFVYGAVQFVANIDSTNTFTVTFNDRSYTVRPWSVLIVDAESGVVVFDTSLIGQTLTTDAEADVEADADKADVDVVSVVPVLAGSVSFLPEPRTLRPESPVILSSSGALEHVDTVKDVSDVLLYHVDFQVDKAQAQTGQVTLALTKAYDYVHVFVNETIIGHLRSVDSQQQLAIKVTTEGTYSLDLFVLTQGLTNYGAYYDTIDRGLLGVVSIDGVDYASPSSSSVWSHQIGLRGEVESYSSNANDYVGWRTDGVDSTFGTPFIWYRIEFDISKEGAITANDHYALDLTSMGKGSVWCHGHHLGRYWSVLGTVGSCDATCDYRGSYSASRCRTGCGLSSQSRYHVPSAWIRDNDDKTKLHCVLFEEEGGTPNNITLLKLA